MSDTKQRLKSVIDMCQAIIDSEDDAESMLDGARIAARRELAEETLALARTPETISGVPPWIREAIGETDAVWKRGRIMPVRVIKRREKWRLVEPDGKIAKTPKGTARDGGGHTDQAKAKSQARAINRSLSKAGKI